MKRDGNLWPQVISFEHLSASAEKARKGKRFQPPLVAFHFCQERALCQLRQELVDKTYRPGEYRTIFIHEPKTRTHRSERRVRHSKLRA